MIKGEFVFKFTGPSGDELYVSFSSIQRFGFSRDDNTLLIFGYGFEHRIVDSEQIRYFFERMQSFSFVHDCSLPHVYPAQEKDIKEVTLHQSTMDDND